MKPGMAAHAEAGRSLSPRTDTGSSRLARAGYTVILSSKKVNKDKIPTGCKEKKGVNGECLTRDCKSNAFT